MHESASEPAEIGIGQGVGDQWRAQAGQRHHPSAPGATNRRVVDDDVLPFGEDPVEIVGRRVGDRQRHMATAARGATDGEIGIELGDAVYWNFVVVVRLVEPCRHFDRGVELQPGPDVVTEPAALEEGRRLNGAATNEHVIGAEGDDLGRAVGVSQTSSGSSDA